MYNTDIDKKWQKIWEEEGINKFNKKNMDKKLYCLEMFSYPSGAKLHVGHWYNYGPTDSWARMKRMQGYEIFQPMGFDAFGLPAENYAIKTGIHPKDSTEKNISTMEKQLKEMGAMFDWDYEVITCNPDYYKWTQWIFLKLYEKGLAYKKKANVNWCPSCSTVLANEQVKEGLCERCDSEVTKKDLEQWFFKITEYAEELLEKLEELDWPEKTKKIQKNWIGKSTGSEVEFRVDGQDLTFRVFTTRVDTLNGVTYVVIAPEHDIVDNITTEQQKQPVNLYRENCKKISEIDRLAENREKTGVFTGSYAINPINGEKVQIWLSDYVLANYGTGCVMAVPAHDERDYEFAKKFNLEIKEVISSNNSFASELPYCDYGILVNSGDFNGLTSEEAKIKITEKLKGQEKGEFKVTYRLRDWLVSRQRYWGSPIPIIYCDKCGTVPVLEKDLPVLLPYDVEFKPDGKSPLAKCEEYINTKCPICGNDAKRDADTLDTFVCSSWYQLRYPDNRNSEKIFDTDLINKILPVDKYVGGAEHAAMHLLYSRFITKVLRDCGLINFDEPFKSLVHQGTILGADGNKMSKSKGNTVQPDEYIEQYGSDVFRLYLMFGFSYIDGGPWNEDGIKAISKFVSRIERLVQKNIELKFNENLYSDIGKNEKELLYILHNTIKSVTEDAEKFQFNTSIARMMELVNAMYKYEQENETNINIDVFKEVVEKLILILAPFAPHFSEEMNEMLQCKESIFKKQWPQHEEKYLIKDQIELAVQINGVVKFKVEVGTDMNNEEIEKQVIIDERLEQYLQGRTIKKIIVIKGRLVNIVL